MKNIKIGADPELFLEREGKIISAEGLVGGTKMDPKFISDEGHAIQEDNIMVEFNIPPSESKKDFLYNINFVKDYLHTLARVREANLNFSASATLEGKYLKTSQAKQFGCEPDFNIYLKQPNEAPNAGGNLRSCGGHIHIGWDAPTRETSEKLVYAMDAILGLESLSLDDDDRRREMYGKAGSFRFKPYGIEYRTLSNFWIKDDNLIEWAYEKTMEAIDLVTSGQIDEIIGVLSEDIKIVIDTNNKEGAKQLLEELKQVMQVA